MNLAVVHNLPAGGMKRALYEQVKRLARKHTIDIYTLSCSDEKFLPLKDFAHRYTILRYNPPVHFPASVFSIYFALPQVYKEMANAINNEKYDVALINPCFLTQSPYILRYLKIPTLYQCPEPKREFYENVPRINKKWSYMVTLPFRLPIKVIDAVNAKYATKVVVHSNYSKRKIDDIYGVRSDVLPLGVDTEKFTLISPPSRSPSGQLEGVLSQGGSKTQIVLSVGDLSLHKGFDFLIRSIGLIPKSKRPQLVAVGHAGFEQEYMIKLAADCKVSLIVKENISDEQLISLYNRAQVFVYAARKEPFGLVVLEAACCGLPVLAVAEGGIKELVDNPVMGVAVPRNEQVFAKTLVGMLEKKESETEKNLRRDYVQKKWNWDKSVSRLEKFLSITAGKN